MSLPLDASRRRHRAARRRHQGAERLDAGAHYALDVKPATQMLTRRTVRTLAKGESLTLSPDMFADLVPGTGSVSLSVEPSTALDAATLLQGARPLSVRLLRADHEPRDAAALCQRARGRRASGARHRSRPAHQGRDRPAAGAAGLQRLVRPVVGRRRRRLARRLRHRLPDPGARKGFAVPDVRSRSRSTGCAIPSPTPTSRTRTAAAISPMRSTCWRATARRRSATCAISPTPSSNNLATPIAKAQIAAALGAGRRPGARRAGLCGGARRLAPQPSSTSAASITARRCATRRRW